jgi:hypothetical protein
MTTTTLKLETFLSRPLRDCSLRDVPGVGEVVHGLLQVADIDTAEKLMGQFLLLGRDSARMADWLHDACQVRVQEARKVAEALHAKGVRLVLI